MAAVDPNSFWGCLGVLNSGESAYENLMSVLFNIKNGKLLYSNKTVNVGFDLIEVDADVVAFFADNEEEDLEVNTRDLYRSLPGYLKQLTLKAIFLMVKPPPNVDGEFYLQLMDNEHVSIVFEFGGRMWNAKFLYDISARTYSFKIDEFVGVVTNV